MTARRYTPEKDHTPYIEKARTWRRLHGRKDFQDLQLIKAVRDHFGDDLGLTDWEIIEEIGYVDTGTGAIKKIRTYLSDLEIEQAEDTTEDTTEDTPEPATA